MALVVGTDTYISVADCTTFFGTQLGAGAWTAASAGDKENALRMACARLERLLYDGDAYDASQTLRWPRSGIYDQHGTELTSSTVPQFVKDAQCWEALYLLQWSARGAGNSTREALQAQGVTSTKLGNVSEVYDRARADGPWRCDLGPAAFRLLSWYLRRVPEDLKTGLEAVA